MVRKMCGDVCGEENEGDVCGLSWEGGGSLPQAESLATFTTTHISLPQEVTDSDLPLDEMGFSSTAELLQRVSGVEVVRPPNSVSIMVFSTWPDEDKEKVRKMNTSVYSSVY